MLPYNGTGEGKGLASKPGVFDSSARPFWNDICDSSKYIHNRSAHEADMPYLPLSVVVQFRVRPQVTPTPTLGYRTFNMAREPLPRMVEM